MPADIATTTTGASTVVTWTDPTATDDVDPAPTVGCTPPSGSAFDLGTTTVTCTATDATGNSTVGLVRRHRHARCADAHRDVGKADGRGCPGTHRPVRPHDPAEAHRERRAATRRARPTSPRPRCSSSRWRPARRCGRGHRHAGGRRRFALERRSLAPGPRHERTRAGLHAATSSGWTARRRRPRSSSSSPTGRHRPRRRSSGPVAARIGRAVSRGSPPLPAPAASHS